MHVHTHRRAIDRSRGPSHLDVGYRFFVAFERLVSKTASEQRVSVPRLLLKDLVWCQHVAYAHSEILIINDKASQVSTTNHATTNHGSDAGRQVPEADKRLDLSALRAHLAEVRNGLRKLSCALRRFGQLVQHGRMPRQKLQGDPDSVGCGIKVSQAGACTAEVVP